MSDAPVIPISPTAANLRQEIATAAAARQEGELNLKAAIEKLNKLMLEQFVAVNSFTQRVAPQQKMSCPQSLITAQISTSLFTIVRAQALAVSLLAATQKLYTLQRELRAIVDSLDAENSNGHCSKANDPPQPNL